MGVIQQLTPIFNLEMQVADQDYLGGSETQWRK